MVTLFGIYTGFIPGEWKTPVYAADVITLEYKWFKRYVARNLRVLRDNLSL